MAMGARGASEGEGPALGPHCGRMGATLFCSGPATLPSLAELGRAASWAQRLTGQWVVTLLLFVRI